MAEEEQEEQQTEEKLKVELPGLFGGRRRGKKARAMPEDEGPTEDDESTEALQPFEDEAEQDSDEEDDEVEERPAAAPVSRFTPPGAPAVADPPRDRDVEENRRLPDGASADSIDAGSTDEGATHERPTEEPAPRKVRTPLPPMAVAVVVGLFVGVLACGLTYAGMVGCKELRGTSACGGPGFFVLMAIIAMLVAIGSFLLKTFGLADPTSTSLLAVGLVAVVALAFLIEVIFAWWMILVIPLLSAAAYAGSHQLTRIFTTVDAEG